ncbi:MAG: hypothetical protein KY475_02700 [Planctomycetes bacterium]|nr:hypothetical protein [Planctomycetota bacterium]
MNLLGKIFTVLIFIMSLVFMSFAVAVYATHTNWKMKVIEPTTGLKPQLAQQKEINDQLQAEILRLKNDIAKEKAARVNALATLEAKLLDARDSLTQKEDELAKLQSAHQVLVETNDNTQDMLTVLTDEVNNLRDEIRTAQQDRDEQFAQVVALTDLLNQARGELGRLDERYNQLLAQNATMSRVLEKNGLEAETPVSHIPPRLDGVVLQVSEGDLLEVSIGSDDGLKKGHLLEVFRGNQYLGRVEVVSTKPDVSVARILKPYHRGPIQRGDNVRTKVN